MFLDFKMCDLNAHNSEICTILFLEFFVCAKHGTQGFTSARQVLHYWARLWFWYFKITFSNNLLIFCHVILSNNFISLGIFHIVFSISSLFILCQSYPQLMKYIEWNWMEFWTNKEFNVIMFSRFCMKKSTAVGGSILLSNYKSRLFSSSLCSRQRTWIPEIAAFISQMPGL